MTLKLFMPLAEGQTIPFKVYKSLSTQTVETEIIPCVSKGVLNSNGNVISRKDRAPKIHSEVFNRNKISELIGTLGITDEYIVMQDRDAEQLYSDNLEKAVSFLNINRDYAAVALPSDRAFDRRNHIIITCVVFRTEFMKTFKFRAMPEMHTCESTRKDIIAAGYKYDYLVRDKSLIYEIKMPDDMNIQKQGTYNG